MKKNKATKKQEKRNKDVIIGANIRLQRELRGISRDELAMLMDVTISHLGLMERGERGVTSSNLQKISEILDTPIGILFNDRDIDSASETNDDQVHDSALFRVKTMLNCLEEPELILLSHTIKGIMALREARENKAAN